MMRFTPSEIEAFLRTDKVLTTLRRGKIFVQTTIKQPEGSAHLRHLEFCMVGHTSVPVESCGPQILDFESYAERFPFVDSVTIEHPNEQIRFHADLFSRQFESIATFNAEGDILHFHVIQGTLKGCTGLVHWTESLTARSGAVILVFAEIDRPRFPIPDMLIAWGAKWVIAKGADLFRKRMEKQVLH